MIITIIFHNYGIKINYYYKIVKHFFIVLSLLINLSIEENFPSKNQFIHAEKGNICV